MTAIGELPLERKKDKPADRRGLVVSTSALSLSLLLLLVLVTPFIEMTGEVGEAGKTYRLYAYALIALLQIGLVIARGWRETARFLSTAILAPLLWFALSLVWASPIDLALKRLALLGLVYVALTTGVCDIGYRRSIAILRILLACALALNYLVVLALPDIGTQSQGIAHWCGFMAHKNIAGMVCAVTVLVFSLDGRGIPAIARYAVIGGALIFLCQSWSRTAMIALLVAFAIGFTLTRLPGQLVAKLQRREKDYARVVWASFAILMIVLLLVTVERDFLLSLTNDATAISRRGSIWRPMVQFYLDHPLLGSGYGTYWDPTDGGVAADAFTTQKWLKDVDQGHNGYLDILVQVGFPGLLLSILAAFFSPLARLPRFLGAQPQRAALVFSLIMFALVENGTESTLFADNAVGNVFLLFALAQLQRFGTSVSRSSKQRRGRRQSPGGTRRSAEAGEVSYRSAESDGRARDEAPDAAAGKSPA